MKYDQFKVMSENSFSRKTHFHLYADIFIDGQEKHVIVPPRNQDGNSYTYSVSEAYNLIGPLVRAHLEKYI